MMVSFFTVAHNGPWIQQTWPSLADQPGDFEWIIGLRPGADASEIPADPRVKRVDVSQCRGVGDAKRRLVAAARGDIVVDVAAGDILAERVIQKLIAPFGNPAVGFVAGDVAEDWPGSSATGAAYAGRNGEQVYGSTLRGRSLPAVKSPMLSAMTLTHVKSLPRGLSSWRKFVYDAMGGHDVSLVVAADYDLLCRTYLTTTCHLLGEPVCIVTRGSDDASYSRTSGADIQRLCGDGADATYPSVGQPVTLRDKYLHALVARESDLRKLPRYDIGGGIFGAPGWKTLDISGAPDIQWDVFGKKRLPFDDNSLGAFRAFDFLEHGEDADAFWFMDEVHRCLAPGGWFVSYTPHALGIGASCDPSHRARWDERRFLYWCSDELRPFLLSAYPKATAKFQVGRLFVERRIMGPAPWRFDVPYVVADLMKV